MRADLEADIDGMRALVAEWLARHGPSGVDADAEVAAWLAQPEEERLVVRSRLKAFLRLRASDARGDPARVAHELGLGRSNLYRLMGRMSEAGPVSGLIAHRRARGVRSATRDGFGQPWDRLVAEVLTQDCAVAAPTMRNRLVDMAREMRIAEPPPGISALRRRLDRLRSVAGGPSDPAIAIGSTVLVDQVGLGLVVPGRGGGPVVLGLMLVLDGRSGIVLGHSVFGDDVRDALARCVASSADALLDLGGRGVPIAERIDELDWMAPSRLAESSGLLAGGVPANRRPGTRVSRSKADRHGGVVIRRLGNRLDDIPLVRMTLRDDGGIEATVGTRPTAFADAEEVGFVIGASIRRLNEFRAAAMPRIGARGRAANVRRAEALVEDIALAFRAIVDDRR